MTTPTPVDNGPGAADGTRKRRLLWLTLLIVVVAMVFGLRWYLHGRHHVSTDDAYVAAHLIHITPRLAGTVTEVLVDNTQYVDAGAVLVRLDDSDARLALSRAEAELAATVRRVNQGFARLKQQRANVVARQRVLEQAQADLRRRQQALAVAAVSAEEAERAQSLRDQAAAQLLEAQAALTVIEAEVGGTTVARHPDVLQAETRLRAAWQDLARCVIRAPLAGQLEKRSVQPGQQVSPGHALMALVPMEQLWVEANFKEDQLKDMRAGQPVELISDMYGSDVVFHGKVSGFSPGTGSVFSLLPAQNASGNWIKIVQRLPVRIALQTDELVQHPLRVGLSMLAEVDVSHQEGQPLSTPKAAEPLVTFKADELQGVEARIDEIVAHNLRHLD